MDIKTCIQAAIDTGASDLHMVVGLPPTLRIDGKLRPIEGEPAVVGKDLEKEVFTLITPQEKEYFLEHKDLDFGLAMSDGTRMRVNVHLEKGNMGMVARVISNNLPSLESINMPQITYDLLSLKQGLILVTGPTGCGKSTTLAAMLNSINQNRAANIITFEDPIEYVFKPQQSLIIQRQLGSDMTSFAEGLKHAMRQDPNVIMVGEMRDLETISATITLAETGHLVLATLHTYSASQTIDRIIDIFPPHQQNQVRTQLSMTLAAVISQRLLEKVGGGRVSARELMINTPAVANLIREGKVPQLRTVIETGSRDGMISLDQDIRRLYKEGLIDKKTAQMQMDVGKSQ
jgi:twitching motility protein PilT